MSMARSFGTEPSPSAEPKVSAASAASVSRASGDTDLHYVLHGWRDRLVPRDQWDTSDQYTTLQWKFTDHRDGEIATYKADGLWVWCGDYDGDCSEWRIRKGKGGPILAAGNRYDGNHFFACLHDAEAALRRIIVDRVTELRGASQGTAARSAETSGLGPQGNGPVGLQADAPSLSPPHPIPAPEPIKGDL